MAYKIEFVSIKNNGVKFYNEDWRNVVGKAAEFLPQFKKGDVVDAKFDEKGDVTYIGFAKEGEIAEATDATTNLIKDTLGDIFDALENLSSQFKRIDMRMKRIEEKLGVEDKAEFKRADETE